MLAGPPATGARGPFRFLGLRVLQTEGVWKHLVRVLGVHTRPPFLRLLENTLFSASKLRAQKADVPDACARPAPNPSPTRLIPGAVSTWEGGRSACAQTGGECQAGAASVHCWGCPQSRRPLQELPDSDASRTRLERLKCLRKIVFTGQRSHSCSLSPAPPGGGSGRGCVTSRGPGRSQCRAVCPALPGPRCPSSVTGETTHQPRPNAQRSSDGQRARCTLGAVSCPASGA